ncbi:hypothetical protein [Thalassiella azotivora]
MSVRPLADELAAARRHLAALDPTAPQALPDNRPGDVASWLATAHAAAEQHLEDSGTFYVWLNDLGINHDQWFVTAIANGPGRTQRGVGDYRDSRTGDQVTELLGVPDLTVTGVKPVQAWLSSAPFDTPERDAVEAVAVLAVFDLVQRGLRNLPAPPAHRVAMSRGEEWRVCVWEDPTAVPVVHTWHPSAPD